MVSKFAEPSLARRPQNFLFFIGSACSESDKVKNLKNAYYFCNDCGNLE